MLNDPYTAAWFIVLAFIAGIVVGWVFTNLGKAARCINCVDRSTGGGK
ncbi:MAG: hypothetical protein M0Z48_00450 [Nitrospiraceae bacterium]|nr:hypothetical protein [Nitrospiraceae bacterium]